MDAEKSKKHKRLEAKKRKIKAFLELAKHDDEDLPKKVYGNPVKHVIKLGCSFFSSYPLKISEDQDKIIKMCFST